MRLSTIGLRRAVNVRYEIYSRDAELSSVASISAAISYLSLPLRLRALGLPLLTRPTVLSLNRVCSTCSKVIGFAIREKKKKKINDIRPLLRSRDSFFWKKKRKKNERSIPINRGWKYLSIKIALDVTSMIDIEVEGL